MVVDATMAPVVTHHINQFTCCAIATIPGADPGFGQGGAQLPRLKVADIVEHTCVSEVRGPGPAYGPWKLSGF